MSDGYRLISDGDRLMSDGYRQICFTCAGTGIISARIQHNRLKIRPELLRAAGDYVGVLLDDEPLELFNCPVCFSTISIPGIGPVTAEASKDLEQEPSHVS